MINWVEIAQYNSHLRFTALSDFLNQNGCANKVHFVECDPLDFSACLTEQMEKFKYLRFGSPFGQEVVSHFNSQGIEVRNLKAADTLIKDGEVWRLSSSTFNGLKKVLNTIGHMIDLSSQVLVVGSGAGARAAIGAFSNLGIKKVNIASKYAEEAKVLIDDLEKTYFDVDFEFVPEENLVLLPGTNSVLVNTTPMTPANDLLDELNYFNFLKTPGVVIDFTFSPMNTPLINEAEQLNIPVVRGFQISCYSDLVWAELVFNKKLNPEAYNELLMERITQDSKQDSQK